VQAYPGRDKNNNGLFDLAARAGLDTHSTDTQSTCILHIEFKFKKKQKNIVQCSAGHMKRGASRG